MGSFLLSFLPIYFIYSFLLSTCCYVHSLSHHLLFDHSDYIERRISINSSSHHACYMHSPSHRLLFEHSDYIQRRFIYPLAYFKNVSLLAFVIYCIHNLSNIIPIVSTTSSVVLCNALSCWLVLIPQSSYTFFQKFPDPRI